MDGVTILNTIVSNENIEIGIVLIILGITILFISVLGIIFSIIESNKFDGFTIFFIFGSIFSLGLLILGRMAVNELKEKTTYEVIISGEVSLTEFTSKYEIIEQRGEIYVIKEREENKQ